jgi:hypothetical protein
VLFHFVKQICGHCSILCQATGILACMICSVFLAGVKCLVYHYKKASTFLRAVNELCRPLDKADT